MSLVPGVVYGTTPPPAAHTAVPVGHLWNASKGWWGGKSRPVTQLSRQLATPGALKHPRAHSSGLGPLVPPEFPAETLVKGSHFAHGDPYFPPHQEETRLRYATRHLPMQKSVGPFRAICARSFGSAPVNWPCCRGLFMALTPASSECKIQVNPPPPYGYWGPFGPLRLSEIEVGTHMFTGKREK
jgi:hypothetical protein